MQIGLPDRALRIWYVRIDHEEAVGCLGRIVVGLSREGVRWSTRSLCGRWSSAMHSVMKLNRHLRRVVNLLPRLTALLPYETETLTVGLIEGMSVGTTPEDLKAETTRLLSPLEMPRGEHDVARFSVGVGAAKASDAQTKKAPMVGRCILLQSNRKYRSVTWLERSL